MRDGEPFVTLNMTMDSDSRVVADEFSTADGTRSRLVFADRHTQALHFAQRDRIFFQPFSLTDALQFFKDVFLPAGYPHSVTSDYFFYQLCDSIQAFFSSITGLLATRAVLKGAGVGNSESTSTGALLTWVLKDGAGMVGKILFAWRVSTRLDSDAKSWRFAADVLNDSAIFIEVASSHLPYHLFPYLAASATIVRAACGVAAGASKSALVMHFAKQGNAGDLSAKESSQETVVGLCGMLVGALLLSSIPDSPPVTYFVLLLGTCIHLFVNWLGVRYVVLPTLNRQRTSILVEEWLRALDEQRRSGGGTRPPAVLTPEEVAKRERVFWWGTRPGISLGCGLRSVLGPSKTFSHLSTLAHAFRHESYLLALASPHFVNVALHETASSTDVFRSYFHALCLATKHRRGWDRREWDALAAGFDGALVTVDPKMEPAMHTLQFVQVAFGPFLTELRQRGWDVVGMETRSLLEEGSWRFRIGEGGKGE